MNEQAVNNLFLSLLEEWISKFLDFC